jgi:ParB-like chromosome segregation protein Spo0J
MNISKIAPALQPFARALTTLHEDPENAREHDGASIDAIATAFKKFGQLKPIVVRHDGRVIAGNGAFRAAKVLGWTEIAAITFEGSDEEATAYAIADNRVAEYAEWNTAELDEQIAALHAAGEDVAALGFTPVEVATMVRRVEGEQSAAAATFASTEPNRDAGVLASTVSFKTDADLVSWQEHLKQLRAQFPKATTNGERLVLWIQEVFA